MNVKLKLLMIPILFGWGLEVLAQSNKLAEKRIDSLFTSYTKHTPGVAVAVVKNGKVVFKKGYGIANFNYDIPITPRTVFDIASVSKQFTAFAIYLLENEGKLSLEDPVVKYVPELPEYAHPIKIKHLLAHTSGLSDQGALNSIAGYFITDVTTSSQIIKAMTRRTSLLFLPGTAFSYCNSSYVLLAEVVHRITKKSFSDYTREKIFNPLGMSNTLFCDNPQLIVKNKAESYEKIGASYFHRPSFSTTPGPSGLLTTVEDLVKWVLNFENPIVGNAKLIERFNEVSYLDNGKKVFIRIDEGDSIFYAKGQFVTQYRGVNRIGHGGHTAGYRTFLGRFPEQRLSIIQLSNDEHNENLGGRYDIAHFYIENSFTNKQEAFSNKGPIASTNVAPTHPLTFSANLNDFAGKYYCDELDTRYNFVVINDNLVMQHVRLDDIILRRTGELSFTGDGPNTFFFEITFKRDENEMVNGYSISNWGAKNVKFLKQEQ